MTTKMVFDVVANDHASRVFRKVADAGRKMAKSLGDGAKLANLIAMRTALVGLGVQAAPAVGALVSAIAGMVPAALVAVPAIIGLVTATQALKLATHGVADAFAAAASGDAKDFAEALKQLSPQARQFVREGAKLIPVLRKTRSAVQDTFFSKIPDGSLTKVTKNLLPTLRMALTGVSAAAGRAAANVLAFLKSAPAKSSLGATFTNITKSMRALERVPVGLLKALTQVSAAASPFLVKMSAGFARMIDGFTSKVNSASSSGGITKMIQQAMDIMGQFGRIAGNVGRILSGVFSAGEGSNTLLDTIERISGAIAGFVNSERGQQILSKVMATLAAAAPVVTVVALLTSAITGLVGVFSAVFTPAGGVAAAIGAVAGGFAYLWLRVQPARELLSSLGAKFAELASLIREKGLPVLIAVGRVLQGTLVAAFERINAAVQRNRPQLEELWMAFKLFAEFVMTRVAPVLVGPFIHAISASASWLSFMIAVIGRGVDAFNGLLAVVLNSTRAMLSAAVLAFGWVPGLGKKLHEAQDKFETFANKVTYNINNIPDELALKTSTPGSTEALGELGKVDAATRKIPGSKATKITTPGSVNAKLELSALKVGLMRLTDKIIGLKTRGVPVTAADLNSLKAKAEALERTYAVKVRVDGGTAAAASLNAVKAAAERAERVYSITTIHNEVYAAKNKPPGRAIGGPVRKGQPYIVGERRPELFVPEQNGRIMPRVPAAMGGGPGRVGTSQPAAVRIFFDMSGADSEFMQMIRKVVRVEGGGNAQLAFGKAGR